MTQGRAEAAIMQEAWSASQKAHLGPADGPDAGGVSACGAAREAWWWYIIKEIYYHLSLYAFILIPFSLFIGRIGCEVYITGHGVLKNTLGLKPV